MSLFRTLAATALLTLSASAWAGNVSMTTADGVQLNGVLEGSGEKGVLLVHNKGRSAADWGTFHKKLSTKGFQVLAVDLRGHGESGGDKPTGDEDYAKMTADVTAGVQYLKDHGAAGVAIVGAELGANLGANVAADNEAVTNLVLLSAGMNISGVRSGGAVEKYGDRPVLIVASEEETYANRSAAYLEGKAQSKKMHVEILRNAGAGTKMLTRDPQLEGIVFAWLNETFFLTAGGEGQAGAQKDLATGDTSAVETTGTEFGASRDEKEDGSGDEPEEPTEPMKELNLDD